jgi:hypothetical protein
VVDSTRARQTGSSRSDEIYDLSINFVHIDTRELQSRGCFDALLTLYRIIQEQRQSRPIMLPIQAVGFKQRLSDLSCSNNKYNLLQSLSDCN